MKWRSVKLWLSCMAFVTSLCPVQARDCAEMQKELEDYVAGKPSARIGVAVIIEGRDTVSVNGHEQFPMLSVYKFPQALYVANYCINNDIPLSTEIDIAASELLPDTYSPMRDVFAGTDFKLPINSLLEYTLIYSDNNACDILFDRFGSPGDVNALMKEWGFNEINIISTEAEMHEDISLCYRNSSSPIAMAKLLDKLYSELLPSEEVSRDMKYDTVMRYMGNCKTGRTRLAKALTDENTDLYHKTGTGDINSEGKIIAINDAGYVISGNTPDYSIAVFVSDSAYDMTETETIISDISSIVYRLISITD